MRLRSVLLSSSLVLTLAACERRPASAPKRAPGGPSDGQEAAWAGAYVSARDGAELLDEEGQPFGAVPLDAPLEALPARAHGGHALVHVLGAVEAWGELDRAALGRHVRAQASLDGPPRALVAAGDVVQLLAPLDGATARVRAHVRAPRAPGEATEPATLDADGALSADALTAEPVTRGSIGEGGFTADGAALVLLDAPEGKVVWSLPIQPRARHLRVLGRQGAWTRVAFGEGPYVDAWTRAPIEADEADEAVTIGRDTGVPASIGTVGTLLCVRAGTDVRAGNRLLAKTHVPTFARQLGRPDDDKRTVKVRLGAAAVVAVTGTIDVAQARMVPPTDPRCP